MKANKELAVKIKYKSKFAVKIFFCFLEKIKIIGMIRNQMFIRLKMAVKKFAVSNAGIKVSVKMINLFSLNEKYFDEKKS